MKPCGKIGHQARKDAQAQRRFVKGKHGGLNVYRCHRCGLWHIGRGRPVLKPKFEGEEAR